MVKKLIKHECIYYLRTLSLFLPIVLIMAVITRLFIFLDSSIIFLNIIKISSISIFVLSCLFLMVISTVICIQRFYKNMYSAEGYLTFTLPVTNAEHIFVKLLVAVISEMTCLLTIIASICIVISSQPFSDLINYINGALNDLLLPEVGVAGSVLYVIEVIILLLTSSISTLLLYYACITIGQTAKKNRVLAALGAYFAYYLITQMLNTIFSIVSAIAGSFHFLQLVLAFIESNTAAAMHIYFCGVIIANCITATIFWIVTQKIMTKKLNLE